MGERKSKASKGSATLVDRGKWSKVSREVNEAMRLAEGGRLFEGLDRLESLESRFPRHREVLWALLRVYADLEDPCGMQRIAERLAEMSPPNSEVLMALITAALQNSHPALAVKAGRRFLQLWPDAEESLMVRDMVSDFEKNLPQLYHHIDPTESLDFHAIVALEEGLSLMERGEFREAGLTFEELTRRVPGLVSVKRYLALAHLLDGRYARAIAVAQQILVEYPEDCVALAYVARAMILSGQAAEAEEYVARLDALPSPSLATMVSRAEVYSFLGRDKDILGILHTALESGVQETQAPEAFALLYHYAAVASMRLRRVGQARRYWQHSLDLDATLAIAEQNLVDLEMPVSERMGPWAFNYDSWIPDEAWDDYVRLVEPAVARSEDNPKRVEHALSRYVKAHPEIRSLVPLLLDRGDLMTRSMALQLCAILQTPDLLASLRDFALGKRGSDEERLLALQVVEGAGLIRSVATRMWLGGRWEYAVNFHFQLVPVQVEEVLPETNELRQTASDALWHGENEQAAELLEQVLAVNPQSKAARYDLAVARMRQGRAEEATAMIEALHQEFPDYLLAAAATAQTLLGQGDRRSAKKVLKPLLQREEMDYSEFAALSVAMIDLELAEGKVEAAREWFETWEGYDPDAPLLDGYRELLSGDFGAGELDLYDGFGDETGDDFEFRFDDRRHRSR